MDKKDLAIGLHDKKYNCCQAVACSFAEEAGMDMKTLFKLGEGFGAGMGGRKCTCGALSGAVMLAGCINSDGNTDAPATKAETYVLTEEITRKFIDRVGAHVCEDIKGSTDGVVKCSCPDCIKIGVDLVSEVLKL